MYYETDIKCIPLERGFMYLTAAINWYSRHVFSWRLSDTLDSSFCFKAVEDALSTSKHQPELFNTDQGVQFTNCGFIEVLQSRAIKIAWMAKDEPLTTCFLSDSVEVRNTKASTSRHTKQEPFDTQD